MNDDAQTPKRKSWFDGELAVLVGFFALLWALVGSGGYLAYPVFACLNFDSTGTSSSCARALEMSMLPSWFKSEIRKKQIETHANAYDYQKALAVIADEEKAAETSVWLLEKKANVLRYDNRPEEAAAVYREVLKREPSNEAIAETLVSLEIDTGNIKSAREVAAAFVNNNLNSSAMVAWQGRVEYQDGDNELALGFFKRAISLDHNNSFLYREVADIKLALKNPQGAIEAISTAISMSPDNENYLDKRAEIYEAIGEKALSQADYEKSISISRVLWRLINLGRSYTDSGDYDKALPLLDEAIGFEEEVEWALASKARLLVFQNKLEDAKLVVKELHEKVPDGLDGRYWQAIIASKEGRYEDARAGFQSIVSEWRHHSDSRLELGHALIDLNRASESIHYFTEVIVNWPQSDVAYTARARGHYHTKNWLAALSDANQSIKLRPKQGAAHSRRGLVLAKLGRLEEAKISLAMAVSYEPKHEQGQRDYLDFLIANGMMGEAKTVFQKALVSLPNASFISEYEAKLK